MKQKKEMTRYANKRKTINYTGMTSPTKRKKKHNKSVCFNPKLLEIINNNAIPQESKRTLLHSIVYGELTHEQKRYIDCYELVYRLDCLEATCHSDCNDQ
jgi:hypothetical protein